MRGLVVPDPTEDFTADPVELFFDLAFVFAFSQLVHLLLTHPDWDGVGRAALIMFMIWMPWTQFTWAANAVPGNQRSVRLVFLLATAASVPMAAAVETALDASGLLFAIPLSVIHLTALMLMVTGLKSGTPEFASAIRYFIPNAVAVVLIIVGGVLEGNTRIVLWIVSVIVVVGATLRASNGSWIVRPGHFAERHGLIIIVALGEVIVALGNAVVEPLSEGGGFESTAVVALVATGAAAGLLWWAYFDRVQPAFEHRAEELSQGDMNDGGRFARDVYSYSHLPVVAGIILTAVALEYATLHASDEVPLAFRMMLLGGIGLFFGGVGAGVFRAFRVVARERLVALAALAVVAVAGSSLPGVVLIVVLDVLILAALIAEHVRIESHTVEA